MASPCSPKRKPRTADDNAMQESGAYRPQIPPPVVWRSHDVHILICRTLYGRILV
jgi:hypothetical protein